MLEKNNYHFYDVSGIAKTKDIDARATVDAVSKFLASMFPQEKFESIDVVFNDSGSYTAPHTPLDKIWGNGKPIKGLPPYYEVTLNHITGEHTEEIILWTPVAWNGRFAGTAGGGTATGGRTYLTEPDNTQRGWTVPMCVINGFSAATANANNIKGFHDFVIDKKSGKFDAEYYENWRCQTTHNMTVFCKAIVEFLHDRPIEYSYFNGGSGGGRQSLMEVQNYPEDYDGVWATCPAINWNKFLIAGFWPEVVMNEHKHFLSAGANKAFIDCIHEACGGSDAYYKLHQLPAFDAFDFEGTPYGHGKKITKADCEVMSEIWKGPHTSAGDFMWYSYLPGSQNWLKVIPIGTYYYPLFTRRVKPFVLAPYHARWITEDAHQKFDDITQAQFEDLFTKGNIKFADSLADDVFIDEFVEHGGKLILDHGMDDPLIPVLGTVDYWTRMCEHFGGKDKVSKFCKLYINPGDNHGNCQGNDCGMTQATGSKALIDWVENGIEPGTLPTVRVSKKNGETLDSGETSPYAGDKIYLGGKL